MSRFDDLEREVRRLGIALAETQKAHERTRRDLERARFSQPAGRLAAERLDLQAVQQIERRAERAEQKIAQAERQLREIGVAGRNAARFAQGILSKIGGIGSLVDSEGFQRFFARTTPEDLRRLGVPDFVAQDVRFAASVAADAADGASRLGSLLPGAGQVVGALAGAALGSQRFALRREGLRREIEQRDRAFLARREREEASEAARREIVGTAKVVGAVRDSVRQGQVGVEFVRQVDDQDAALRRARAGAGR